ncbi:MAG: glycoside hydrolase family 55 protein [Fimbriiglobus sp.]|nr:glycoside hydrolase family 55 protein [Fimbriiglobus sp.]
MHPSPAQCLLIATILAYPANLLAGSQGYPQHANVVDVTRAPYSAKGDGVSDDTKAIQRALNENVGWHRVLYFPKGTYLVSATLTWPKTFAKHDNWGKTILRGADRDTTVIRLADNTFTDDKKPAAIMWCGGFGSADWFHNYVENLTFDVGRRNPGAIGLQFYSNNTGAVRDCRFVAAEGSGAVGLDLSHRDMNGPLLVKDCEVLGFARGVTTSRAVNSQTFENLTLRGQSQFGFTNEGQSVSIRGLVSENAVPAISTYGRLMLTDATISGRKGGANHPAIVNFNGGLIFLRDVKTTGYKRALADLKTPDFAAAYRIEGEDKLGSLGPDLKEYSSHAATTAFPSRPGSLRLPVKETPSVHWETPTKWAVVDEFGADPTAKSDSATAIQKAIDSGATTVFLPGHYKSSSTIIVRGKVERIVGLGGHLNYGQRKLINFRIADGDSPTVCLEHFAHLGGGIEIDTKRTVVLRSMESHTIQGTPRSEGGEVFLEDVVGDNFRFRKQRVWARQLNIENEGTHLTNDAGDVWVLGYKTERGGTLAYTSGGGRTEILGGFSYTTTAGKLAPMFVNDNSSVWAFFGEVCYNGDPYAVMIRETRNRETKEVKRGDGPFASYSGVPTTR